MSLKSFSIFCRNRFPASCAEVGHQELWQRALLGFAVVSSSEQVVAPILTRIEDEVLASGELDLVNAETEFIHY